MVPNRQWDLNKIVHNNIKGPLNKLNVHLQKPFKVMFARRHKGSWVQFGHLINNIKHWAPRQKQDKLLHASFLLTQPGYPAHNSTGFRKALEAGPRCPQHFFSIMQFYAIFWGNPLFWANYGLRAPPLGVKTPLGPTLSKILDPRQLNEFRIPDYHAFTCRQILHQDIVHCGHNAAFQHQKKSRMVQTPARTRNLEIDSGDYFLQIVNCTLNYAGLLAL